MITLFIIIPAGFFLYALLKPPAEAYEEQAAANEVFTDYKLTGNG